MAFMRHNNNGRRHNNRHRHQNGQNNQNGQRRNVNRINHVFESNGPEGRIRGTAQQIVEKYSTMARDANASGDKVLSLNYWQHAEHYQRLYNEILEESAAFEREREQNRQQQSQQPDVTDAGEQQSDAQAQQPREQRQPRQAPSQDGDDENALPNFLQVPISSGAPADRPERGQRPQQQQRPRRAAASAAAEEPSES